MEMPPVRGVSSLLRSIAFINASYTLIALRSAATVGVFTLGLRPRLAKGEGQQLQKRDNHPALRRARFWKGVAYLKCHWKTAASAVFPVLWPVRQLPAKTTRRHRAACCRA
jgi:hypothetical protein